MLLPAVEAVLFVDVGLRGGVQADRGRGVDVDTAALPQAIGGTATPGLAALGVVAGHRAVVQAGRPTGHEQPAPEPVAAVAGRDVLVPKTVAAILEQVALAAFSADGLVVPDGAAIERE